MEIVRPKVGMGVYIINEKGQVLLFLRKGTRAEGTWCAPGGHLEMGESFFDCAKKETMEEVGLEIKEIEILGVVNNIYSENSHYVNIDVVARGVSGIPQLMEPEKSEKLGWFDFDNLPEPLLLSMTNLFKQHPELKDKLKNINSFDSNENK